VDAAAKQRQIDGLEWSVEFARSSLEALGKFAQEPQIVSKIKDTIVCTDEYDIPVRIYQPINNNDCYPVMIYFHGGGHMCGSIAIYDKICRRMANETGHIVISVDYRLSPEFMYPAGLNDCLTVVQNIESLLEDFNVDLQRLVLAGDSAGGNNAASVVYQMHLSGDIRISKLLLIYPELDLMMSSDSYHRYAHGFLLETVKIKWFFDHYIDEVNDRQRISPLYFPKKELFPETMIVAAGLDPLVDEGRIFCEQLNSSGGYCEYLIEPDLIHAFFTLDKLIPLQIERVYRKINNFLE